MRVALALLSLTLASGCGPSIRDLTPAQLMTIDDGTLCATVARDLAAGTGSELIETERHRRGLSCLASIEETVVDCSPLSIENDRPETQYYPGPNGEPAYIVTVSITNRKPKPIEFAIYWKGRRAGWYRIAAKQTRDYSFVSGLWTQDQMGRPLPDTGAEVRHCRVAVGFGG